MRVLRTWHETGLGMAARYQDSVSGPLSHGQACAAEPPERRSKVYDGRSMAQTPEPSGVDARLARIARDYAADKRVTLGKLFASYGLRVDGKIFAMVVRGKLVVKLPRSRVDELVAAGAARPFDPGHGRLMKEWAELEGARPPWSGLVREAHRFVGGLSPSRAAAPRASRRRARPKT